MRKRMKWIKWLCAALACCVALVPAALAAPPDDASGFVLLSEAVPDAILEIRYYSTYNFVGERIDGYEEPVALLTREAAEALRAVSDDLSAQGYRLKIYDAYRPQAAVSHFVRWAQDPSDVRMKPYFYPELDKGVLFDQGYIASRSGHSRGSTVDLTLFDMATGKEVDMGGTFDYFGELSHPDYSGVTQEQYDNRMLLRQAMTRHGFKGLSTEWWHFTLADEPYRDTYFTFPVRSDSVPHAVNGARFSRGMRGADVRYCQQLLIAAGYLTGTADGSYGPMTEAAVKALQRVHGLAETGVLTDVEIAILKDEAGANGE